MSLQTRPRTSWQRLTHRVAASGPGSWFFARTAHHLDRVTLRLSGGQTTMTAILAGLPVATVTTTGAKSGQPRSVPLVVITDGDRLILFASNFGQAHYPGWYYNLRAHPQATLTVDGQTREYTAREAMGAERDRLWQEAVALYAGYAAYQRRIGDKRHVPVMVLTPAAAGSETEDKANL